MPANCGYFFWLKNKCKNDINKNEIKRAKNQESRARKHNDEKLDFEERQNWTV
jgi:hypothetical protein